MGCGMEEASSLVRYLPPEALGTTQTLDKDTLVRLPPGDPSNPLSSCIPVLVQPMHGASPSRVLVLALDSKILQCS